MTFDYKGFFPHPKIRDQQNQAIDFALNALINSNKKFVIIEAGTGIGKSAIGVTIGRYINSLSNNLNPDTAGTYFVTTQKILQDQYVSDFGHGRGSMSSVKSSSNYPCKFNKNNTCQQSQQMLRTTDKSTKFFKICAFSCTYKEEKKKFLESSESVTNFPYFLTEAAFSKKITPRNLLVVDEAHNIESELSKFIEVHASERFCSSILSIPWPRNISTQFQAFKWIEETYFPKVKSKLKYFESALEKSGLKSRLKEFEKVSRQYDILNGHVTRIETFLKIYDKDNWVFESIPSFNRSMRKFSFKPIDISSFAKDYLFRLGGKVLMMSATILDHKTFCNSLGVKLDEAEFISLSSPFPVENRPIISAPIGKMSMKEIDKTLPKLSSAVNEILDNHKDSKGIIHCHTFKIAKYLKASIGNKRLLIHDSSNREEVLKRHMTSKEPTVLLSPSMAEGVDLKGDASRFQIICKIPYPYLGDKIVKKRMNKWTRWYDLQTAKLIVQSAGRSVRSIDDQAVTYILDSDWERFYRKNYDILPEDFKKCIL
jgi:ATP-dependent DNA helicase DinG